MLGRKLVSSLAVTRLVTDISVAIGCTAVMRLGLGRKLVLSSLAVTRLVTDTSVATGCTAMMRLRLGRKRVESGCNKACYRHQCRYRLSSSDATSFVKK